MKFIIGMLMSMFGIGVLNMFFVMKTKNAFEFIFILLCEIMLYVGGILIGNHIKNNCSS